jgi:dipeptidyl aminopeptidase/acylaminoacyl peptidase
MRLLLSAFLASFILIFSPLGAQTIETDILLFDVISGDKGRELTNMTKVTDRPGYDNQPFFTADGNYILFSSDRDTGQTEIYRYEIATGNTTRLTFSDESEYSPTVSPDGKYLTFVRLERDSTQRLWRSKLDGTKAKPLMADVEDVGYYCWINRKEVAVWTVTDTMLSIVKIKDQLLRPIEKGAGRSFVLDSKLTKMDYLKLNPRTQEHMVMQYTFITGVKDSLVTTWKETQDITSHADGEILIGHHGALYAFLPDSDTEWQHWANLSSHRVTKFYRLATSPDGKKIAVVTYEGAKP